MAFEEDVTERVARDMLTTVPEWVKKTVYCAPPTKITEAMKPVLAKYDGHLMGYVSNVVVYDSSLRHIPKKEHKLLLRLVHGGFMRVKKVFGDLPGASENCVGGRSGWHYKLVAA